MLIKLTRVQGDERAELWLNPDHILFVNRVATESVAKSLIQLMGYTSNVFVMESPEEVLARINGDQ